MSLHVPYICFISFSGKKRNLHIDVCLLFVPSLLDYCFLRARAWRCFLLRVNSNKFYNFILLVFRAFDEDNDGFINEFEWVKGMSIFLRGTLEEKTKCKYPVLQVVIWTKLIQEKILQQLSVIVLTYFRLHISCKVSTVYLYLPMSHKTSEIDICRFEY
jgi:hypothetical protein